MRKEEALRKYNFSDAHLKQLADTVLLLTDRDNAEFADRGFNTNKRAALVQKINFFDTFETDAQLEALKITATQDKDAARQVLEPKMRTVFLMARNVFKETSGRYREFGDPAISQQTDELLVRNARVLINAATKYLVELADEGLTAAKLTDLEAAKQALDDALDVQRQAINDRDIKTEERIEAGNELYELIVKYCEIGRDIWINTHQAKYNDYIIYQIPETQPSVNRMMNDNTDAITESEDTILPE